VSRRVDFVLNNILTLILKAVGVKATGRRV